MKRRAVFISFLLVVMLAGVTWFSIVAHANGWHFGMNSTSDERISQGFGYTMAIKSDNSLWAWGAGVLGDGIDRSYWSEYPAIAPIHIMDSVSSVVALRQRTFAITTDGVLYAWGSGALGDGRDYHWDRPALSPVRVMDSVVSVAAYDTSTTMGNYTTFAITTDGSLWAWGMGQLGDGVYREVFGDNPALTPVRIMNSVVSVHTSNDRAYAIRTDGSLWAWGSTFNGLLGCGMFGDWSSVRTTPVQIMDSVTSVYIGLGDTKVIRTDGSLWAWGYGPIGDGVYHEYERPMVTPIKIMDDVVSVVDNRVIRSDGSLWAWGYGSIGDGIARGWERPALSPVWIMDSVATLLDTGYAAYSMVIKTDGSLWAWGSNLGGQLGDGTASGYDLGNGNIIFYLPFDEEHYNFYDNDRHSPVMILDSVEYASVFYYYPTGATFAIRTDGSLWAWGSNDTGQLGDGTMNYHFSPVRVLDNMGLPLIPNTPAPGQTPVPDPTPGPAATPVPPAQPDPTPRPSGGTDASGNQGLFGGQNPLLYIILSVGLLLLIVSGGVCIIIYFVKIR